MFNFSNNTHTHVYNDLHESTVKFVKHFACKLEHTNVKKHIKHLEVYYKTVYEYVSINMKLWSADLV